MSCDGCMFNTKEAGCDYSFACNTTGKAIVKREPTEGKSKKKERKEIGK